MACPEQPVLQALAQVPTQLWVQEPLHPLEQSLAQVAVQVLLQEFLQPPEQSLAQVAVQEPRHPPVQVFWQLP